MILVPMEFMQFSAEILMFYKTSISKTPSQTIQQSAVEWLIDCWNNQFADVNAFRVIVQTICICFRVIVQTKP